MAAQRPPLTDTSVDLRPSPLAGHWYPGQPQALRQTIDSWLQLDAPQLPGQVLGLLAPHAGHQYSGLVAAHAFRAVLGASFDLVAILCPSHVHQGGPLLTSGHAAYATPLGAVALHRGALAQVQAAVADDLGLPPGEALMAIRVDSEHAIEIQLPFLQCALQPGFALLPIMLGDQSAAVAGALGRALAAVLRGQRALLVASSDLSHFRPRQAAEALDAEMLRQVATLDPAAVLAARAQGRGQACGAGAIAAMLWAAGALGANQARVLNWACSGDTTGDNARVVGYGAAVVLRAAAGVEPLELC